MLQQVLISSRQRSDAQVGNAMQQMVMRVAGCSDLEFGIQRQYGEPHLWRIAGLADRYAGVSKKQPCPLLVISEYFGHQIRPSGEKPGGETWLKQLDRRASFEPNIAVGKWDSENGCPRALVS